MLNVGVVRICAFILIIVGFTCCQFEENPSTSDKSSLTDEKQIAKDTLIVKNIEELEAQILSHVSKIESVNNEQLEKINQIRKDLGNISFANRDEMIQYRKLYLKKLKREILTKEQVKQYVKKRKEQ